jgi:hypothetical protein
MLSELRNVFSQILDDTLLRQLPLNTSVPEHRELSGSIDIIHRKSLSLLCLTPHLPLLYWNVYDKYQANVPTHLSQLFW